MFAFQLSLRAISGPFTSGRLYAGDELVPANEVQANTLIAATTINGKISRRWVHVFFISPSNVLSEYIFRPSTGWRGGSSCTECIDTSGFIVQPGNRVLYAMGNTEAGSLALLRVGFVSAGAPDGLTEADYDLTNGWRLAQMN
ncbi:hypothetical protein B0H13DRAFT_2015800 [Mycena leptocephala]|nr:hypothetical protein B0H13DRAFT_2015800 [Mycena leptocephala]